jgi:hypothetical protein
VGFGDDSEKRFYDIQWEGNEEILKNEEPFAGTDRKTDRSDCIHLVAGGSSDAFKYAGDGYGELAFHRSEQGYLQHR